MGFGDTIVMAPIRSIRTAVAIALVLTLAAGPGTARASVAECERVGIEAEHAFRLPAGLLLAIGRVESGRWDPSLGRVIPWPWAVNLAGAGRFATTKDDAVRLVRSALAEGRRNVDVGCFQVNLQHHPTAFDSLEQAFDPAANARYAASFLADLKTRLGSWSSAVEAYHSANPARAIPYGRAVMGKWDGGAEVRNEPVVRHGIRVWTPSPSGTAPSMIRIETGPAAPVGKTAPGNALASAR